MGKRRSVVESMMVEGLKAKRKEELAAVGEPI
jgi:hypothetical protein